jgi:hypothetical protein
MTDNDKKNKDRKTMIYKTLHRKLKIEQHEHHQNHGCTPEE